MPEPTEPNTTDCRQRFFARYRALREADQEPIHSELFLLPETTAERQPATPAASSHKTTCTLIVPGLLGDSVSAIVAPFLMARRALDAEGYCTEIAWGNGRRGSSYTASLLRQSILDEANTAGAPVNIIAYSKGCADVMHMLVNHPDTHAHVAALVSYAGVVGGSPLADNASWLARTLLQYAPLPGSGSGDGLAIRELSTDFRQQWLQENPLPRHIRYASIAATPNREQVSWVLRSSYDKLARFSPHNDSQVLLPHAILPNSELLAIVKADHWAIALPVEHRLPLLSRTLINRNYFPRRAILRTIIDYLNNEPATNTP